MMPSSDSVVRNLSSLAVFGVVMGIACTDPKTGGSDSGGDTQTDSADTSEPDKDPVWEDLRLETSDTLTGAFASGSGLYVTTEQGQTWLRAGGAWNNLDIDVDEESLNGVWGQGSGESATVVAVGDAGYIGTLTNAVWSVEDIGTPNLESVAGSSIADLVAVGWGGVYVNATGTWEYENVNTNPRFNHIWYDGTTAVAVGEDGAIGVRTAGSWSVIQHDSRRRLYGVSGTSATDVWAVGERGTVLHWDGADWNTEDLELDISFWAVYAASPTSVFVVGNNGTAMRYDGTAWEELPTGVDNVLYAVTGSDTGTIWAVGNRGMTLRYTL